MRMMSRGVTGTPANSRVSTKSIPFRLGLRAQPGSTSAGFSPIRPRQIRLPGSTGMPKCRISPPARTIPAGPTSRRSTTAEAPITSSRSAPAATSPSSARPIASSWCAQRTGGSSEPVSAVIRASVIAIVLSVTLSFRPGSSVTTSPTFRWRNGCSVSGLAPCRASASATDSTFPGTENGMILIVATRSFGATTA